MTCLICLITYFVTDIKCSYMLNSCKYRGFSNSCIYFFVVLPSSTNFLTVGVEGFDFSLDHTQADATFGRTPLDEGSARRRDRYLTTQTLYKTNIHVPAGIRTHDPSKRSATDLRLRQRGRWDRLQNVFNSYNPSWRLSSVSAIIVWLPVSRMTSGIS
jgi:hypothetical protein